MKLCVLLVGEHTLIRKGFLVTLQSLYEIDASYEADNSILALQHMASGQCGHVVIDLEAARMDGIALAEEIRKQSPNARILLLLAPTTEIDFDNMFRLGVIACLPRDVEPVEISAALDALQDRRFYISPSLSNRFLHTVQKKKDCGDSLSLLTERQRDVLRFLAEGFGTKEIAKKMQIGARTVETHRAHIMKRLNIHDVVGLVHFAIRAGLVALPRLD